MPLVCDDKHMMKTFLLGTTLLLGACASRMSPIADITVDSVQSAEDYGNAVYVFEKESGNDLINSILRRNVENSLRIAGFKVVRTLEEADHGVMFSYMTRGVSSIESNPSMVLSNGNVLPGRVYTLEQTERAITVKGVAKKLKDKGEFKTLWMTKSSSVGSTSDERSFFPPLLSAMVPYFKKDTDGQILKTLRWENPISLRIKGVAKK